MQKDFASAGKSLEHGGGCGTMVGISGIDRNVGVVRGLGENLRGVERAAHRGNTEFGQRRGGFVRARQAAHLMACCHQRGDNRSTYVTARAGYKDLQLSCSIQQQRNGGADCNCSIGKSNFFGTQNLPEKIKFCSSRWSERDRSGLLTDLACL
jgi:hypothetical protein